METYFITEKHPNIFMLGKFEDSRYPTAIYYVKKSRYYSCDCLGFYMQHDKTQHKHIKLVKFWQEYLNGESGYMFWFAGNDIEYRKIFND